MTRGGKNNKKKNVNRIPIEATPRARDCPICLEEQTVEDSMITCANEHGFCQKCMKSLIMPCVASQKGECECCGVSWKCPLCRNVMGFPNAWTVAQLFMTEEQQNESYRLANVAHTNDS